MANITSPTKDRQGGLDARQICRMFIGRTPTARSRFLRLAPTPWLLLPVLTIAAYAGVIDNGFCLDDSGMVGANRFVAEAAWGQMWQTSYWQGVTGTTGGLYRPLTLHLITLERLLFGLRPAPYHVVSLVLHGLAGLALATAALRTGLSVRVAWLAGALLCVHPAGSEVVNAVVGMADLLSFIAGVTGAAFLVTARTARTIIMATIVLALASLAKESAAVFAVGAVAALLFHDRRRLPLFGGVMALVVPVAVRGLLTGHLDPGGIGFLDNPLAFADIVTRWLNAPALVIRYLLLVIFPWPLLADYSYDAIPVIITRDLLSWLPPLMLCLSLVVFLWILIRRQPQATLWAAASLSMLALATHVVVPVGTMYAERLAYPVLAAGGIGAATLLADLHRRCRRGVGVVIVGCWLLLCVCLVRQRTADWRDDGTLFASALRVSPRSARAHYGSGGWLQQLGDHEGALAAYREALRIHPRYPDALYNQGAALLNLNRLPEALSSYVAASTARPGFVQALFAVATLRVALDDPEAEAAYREVLQYEPSHLEATRGLARMLAERAR